VRVHNRLTIRIVKFDPHATVEQVYRCGKFTLDSTSLWKASAANAMVLRTIARGLLQE
jgi:hypothetical protein